jgi:4-amino-4-deoxy-L-arabinose transferase-like glycosyltransferase
MPRVTGRWLRPAALAAILAVAAILRFSGLGWGLRHPPQWDESAFVEGASSMLRSRDLDPKFYEYPGLFFLLLAGPMALLGEAPRVGAPAAYLAARAVVAAFGVLSVGLAYKLAARVAGSSSGLVAALFLAVSPIEVSTAHMVRPDVALEAFCLAALLVFAREGEGLRDDLVSGALIGAAASVKPTGILLAPAYAFHRWSAPGRRLRGLVVAAVAGGVVLVATTPAIFIRSTELLNGLILQAGYHYGDTARRANPASGLAFYGRTLLHGFGLAGCLLGIVGLWSERSRLRSVGGAIVFSSALLIVLSGAQAHWVRLLLPCFGVAAMAIALGHAGLVRRLPRLGAVITLGVVAAAIPPLLESAAFARDARRPGTRDRAADWILANVAPGGLVLASTRDLTFDRRSNVVLARGTPREDRLLARAADAIVQPAREAPFLPEQAEIVRFEAVHDPEVEGGPIVISRAPARDRPVFRRVSLEGARLRASSGAGALAALTDGRLDTYWATESPGPAPEWIEVELPAPVRLGRLELRLGRRAPRWGRRIHLSTSDDGVRWRPLVAAPGRPLVDDQPGLEEGGASQVFLVEPTSTRFLRVAASSAPGKRWGMAELELDEETGGLSSRPEEGS